ncbi:AAA family ATPase [Vibrio alginolyticus]|uniref:ATP-dependent nuclease n=1 Tax=Vibrio alginolyticus TaxID=663 RepID=UPI00215CBBC3|nr:AAA family ATPase [Vibrio alginolyticus]MCR9886818.1 AAA family ATPase [Vibrio alginolyticus]
MKIKFIEIYNFRKLKNCKVEFSDRQTLLVGANNSGKTSAIDALICFLDKQKKISSTDITLSNWKHFNEFAASWQSATSAEVLGIDVYEWLPYCPSLDVWLSADTKEVHKIDHLIPTLNWSGEPLGVRLVYQPKDIEKLREDYLREKLAIESLQAEGKKLSLWPRDLKDYLSKKLWAHFEIKAYLLDPSKEHSSQVLSQDSITFDSDPFVGVFKVDTIEASRGFSDPSSHIGQASTSLSSQLNEYYSRHLNPTELPEAEDIDALEAIEYAQEQFDQRLEVAFKDTLGEIKKLGYPGFNDPDIKLSSRINPIDSLEHDAAVIFDVRKQNFGDHTFSLPEQYNGLGYKNLIHIIFRLISFRDKWQRVGKSGKKRSSDDIAIEPIHLVLIEEPEAHLHAQVQQVFIRKAYDVLRKYDQIDSALTTQLVVSTHSSYIAYEAGFENLRYFKRKPANAINAVPNAEVVNLSDVFLSDKERESDVLSTKKFVSRYLKTTHCDLFFSNGIILVEGAAERMLLPHFIEHHHPSLRQSYLSILEIGGAHAQKLRPLIERLEIPTLIITDTDACDTNGNKQRPEKGKKLVFGSDTLKSWFDLDGMSLDEVLELESDKKVKGHVRAAYQCGIQVNWKVGEEYIQKEAIPYTFEDSISLTNLNLFKGFSTSVGMVKKMSQAANKETLEECCQEMFDALKGEKAKMALDLLFEVDPEKLLVPEYIKEGLDWLEKQLDAVNQDFHWQPELATQLPYGESVDA